MVAPNLTPKQESHLLDQGFHSDTVGRDRLWNFASAFERRLDRWLISAHATYDALANV